MAGETDDGTADKTDDGWEVRVREELTELSDKLEKLRAFIVSDEFKKLKIQPQRLLQTQASLMSQYASILDQRIR